jgi:hypothetical protein
VPIDVALALSVKRLQCRPEDTSTFERNSTQQGRVRQMSVGERLSAGLRLYTEQLRVVRGCVAGRHPDWTAAQVEEEIQRRRRVIDQQNAKKCYRPALEVATRQADQL